MVFNNPRPQPKNRKGRNKEVRKREGRNREGKIGREK